MRPNHISIQKFKFSRFCKETIAVAYGDIGHFRFKFSRFCKETIAGTQSHFRRVGFKFSRFCKETIAQGILVRCVECV